jgi:hypothetical protein
VHYTSFEFCYEFGLGSATFNAQFMEIIMEVTRINGRMGTALCWLIHGVVDGCFDPFLEHPPLPVGINAMKSMQT